MRDRQKTQEGYNGEESEAKRPGARFTHAISYRRLTQLFQQLYALQISEGALDAMLQRAQPCFDTEVTAILARLRRSRIVCSDETSVRIDGRTHWNWVFQNDQVVIHVVRNSRAASVITEVMAGHRPVIWVSDLYGAQQGHADLWQICLAHQLRDCQYAIDAGDAVFAPRMKMLLLRAAVLARRRKRLAESTRRTYQRRRSRIERHHDAGAGQLAWQKAAKTLRQSSVCPTACVYMASRGPSSCSRRFARDEGLCQRARMLARRNSVFAAFTA